MVFDDDIQLATFKIRSMISKLPPAPRIVFDKSALLDSVTIADEEYSILDMIGNYQTSGVMVIESLDEAAMPGDNNHNHKRPFHIVESGIVEDIRIMQESIHHALDGIRQVTGVNPVTDGTNTQGDMLKGVMQGMIHATNSALMPHIVAYTGTIERLYNVTAKKWQLMVLNGDITVDSLPVAQGMFKNIKLTSELYDYTMGVYITVDSRDDRDLLLQDLMSKRDFIPNDIYYVIYNCIRDWDIKKAQLILAKHTQDAQMEAHKRQMDIVTAQNEGNAIAARAGEEATANRIIVEYKEKSKLSKQQHLQKIDEIREQAKVGAQKTIVENSVNND